MLAIQRLRATERLGNAAIRARLRVPSESELEALATQSLAPGPLADELGIRPPEPAPEPAGPAVAPHVPRRARIELALGLELHVRNDAGPGVLDLARRLHALSVTGGNPTSS